jgi:hypothetical protein
MSEVVSVSLMHSCNIELMGVYQDLNIHNSLFHVDGIKETRNLRYLLYNSDRLRQARKQKRMNPALI